MKVLCIDTSAKEIGIGIFVDDSVLFEEYTTVGPHYNAVLLTLIGGAFNKTGLSPQEIDVFASTLGPGSFTGIRVGMATMKGFSHALNRRFFGVTTLEILAMQFAPKTKGWAVLDAGRGEVYAALYSRSEDSVKKIKGFVLESLEKFILRAGKNANIATLHSGNLILRLRELNGGAKLIAAEHISMQSFYKLLQDKYDKINDSDLYASVPVYIRPSEAEAALKKRKDAGKIIK